MRKLVPLFIFILMLTGCNNPGGRTWLIPVSIDPSDLVYTPSSMESFEGRRSQLIDSLGDSYII